MITREIFPLSLSRVCMIGAGVGMGVGAWLLSLEIYTPWLIAKALYLVGICFMLFNR